MKVLYGKERDQVTKKDAARIALAALQLRKDNDAFISACQSIIMEGEKMEQWRLHVFRLQEEALKRAKLLIQNETEGLQVFTPKL